MAIALLAGMARAAAAQEAAGTTGGAPGPEAELIERYAPVIGLTIIGIPLAVWIGAPSAARSSSWASRSRRDRIIFALAVPGS